MQDLDFFGEPMVQEPRGRGRPQHRPTTETVNRVKVLLALKWTIDDIADAIGISAPTLREHYSSELAQRSLWKKRLAANNLMKLVEQASGGSVTAIREIDRRLGEGTQKARRVSDVVKEASLGKKEAAQHRAEEGPSGQSKWSSLIQH